MTDDPRENEMGGTKSGACGCVVAGAVGFFMGLPAAVLDGWRGFLLVAALAVAAGLALRGSINSWLLWRRGAEGGRRPSLIEFDALILFVPPAFCIAWYVYFYLL